MAKKVLRVNARQGTTGQGLRYVLIASVVLAVLALVLVSFGVI
ncbi:MAG: hypothetical protein RIC87_02460 [Kiloniellales bacterium]